MPRLVAVMLLTAFENLIASYLLLGRNGFSLYPCFFSVPPSQYFMYCRGVFFPLLLHFCFFILPIEDYVYSMFSAFPKYGGRRKLLPPPPQLSFICLASCLAKRYWNIFEALSNNCWKEKRCFLSFFMSSKQQLLQNWP